jgi:hypothetical protein
MDMGTILLIIVFFGIPIYAIYKGGNDYKKPVDTTDKVLWFVVTTVGVVVVVIFYLLFLSTA